MSSLPLIRPMLARERPDPFDDPDWLYEIKHDGFRALAYIADGRGILRSRNGNAFTEFRELAHSIAQSLHGRSAILDGEVCCLDGRGRSVFTDLLHRRASPYYYAFDLLYLDGEDWRRRRCIERKQQLARMIERRKNRLLYVEHLIGGGVGLYEAACEWDLEGVVAKRKDGLYVPTRTRTWAKIKNPHYSQVKGRKELFEGWRSCALVQ
jgi:bifunctional non-homologous end joining protein LigD